MTKDRHYFGIDISKDVFDVCDNNKAHYQFKNSISGFKKLIKLLDTHYLLRLQYSVKILRHSQKLQLKQFKTSYFHFALIWAMIFRFPKLKKYVKDKNQYFFVV